MRVVMVGEGSQADALRSLARTLGVDPTPALTALVRNCKLPSSIAPLRG